MSQFNKLDIYGVACIDMLFQSTLHTINPMNRIVYRIKDGKVEIAQCKGHYNDK